MAIPDDDRLRGRRTDDYIDGGTVDRTGNPVGMAGLIIVALVLAAFLGWYVFGTRSTDSVGVTRTSPPVTSSPTTGTNTTSNPTTTPKQP